MSTPAKSGVIASFETLLRVIDQAPAHVPTNTRHVIESQLQVTLELWNLARNDELCRRVAASKGAYHVKGAVREMVASRTRCTIGGLKNAANTLCAPSHSTPLSTLHLLRKHAGVVVTVVPA